MLFGYRVVVRVPRLPLGLLLEVLPLLSLSLVVRVAVERLLAAGLAVLRVAVPLLRLVLPVLRVVVARPSVAVPVLRLLLAALRVGDASERLVAVLRVGVVEVLVLVREVAVLLLLRVVGVVAVLRLPLLPAGEVAGVPLPLLREVARLVLLLLLVEWLLRTWVPVVGLLSRVEAAAGVGTVGRLTPGVQAPAGMGAGWWGARM